MNTQHIHDLTLRLCQALDKNYDVVNMDSVMSVISSLEGSPVTKEQLEATRLAKFINHLRRRTKDENLARRAKSLLKKWREMVGIQQQQVVDLTCLTSAADKTTEQYQSRPRSCFPVDLPMNSDATHYNSNSNSNQIYIVPAVTSTTNDVMSSLKNITRDSVITEHAKLLPNSDKGPLESKYKLPESQSQEDGIISSEIGIPPTSFQNVLSCFGVADFINKGMVNDGSMNKATKSKQQHSLSYNSHNYKVDPSPHSQSERNESSYNAPVVIDIQDSNSCSDYDTFNSAIPNKTASIEIASLQRTLLGSNTGFSLCSKSKKVKKEKKRKEKYDYSKPYIVGGITVMSAPLNGNLFNQGHSPPAGQNFEKFERFVDREKLQSTYAEIPSLLDNSSTSSMFLPEGYLNTAEEMRSRRCPSTPDLTFTGKFQKTVISTPNNNLVGQNTQVRGVEEVLKLHVTKSPTRCIPLPELVSETIALSNPTPIAMRDLPRKRGRKKGSKGVDSIIAKEGCRSSQILITPLGCGNKKVKTTKELFAEMQNRKWGAKTAISSPSTAFTIQHQREISRPTSSCSELSRESPRLFNNCTSNAILCTAAMGTMRNDVSTNTLKGYPALFRINYLTLLALFGALWAPSFSWSSHCTSRFGNLETVELLTEKLPIASMSAKVQLINYFVISEISWPTVIEQQTIMESFQTIRVNSFPFVIGCMDGIRFKINAPKHDAISYYDRKGNHSIIMLVGTVFDGCNIYAICDSKLRFLDVFIGFPGSCHDANVWKNSPVYKGITNGQVEIAIGAIIFADSAYPVSKYLMVPYRDNGHLTSADRTFKYYLSSTRH